MSKGRRCSAAYRQPWGQVLVFAFCLFLYITASILLDQEAVAATNKINIYFNGTLLNPAVAPYIDANGRTMVPIRVIMETMNARVDWIDAEKKVRIQRDSTTLEMWIGSRMAKLNGQTLKLDTEPVLRQGTTMVPVRVIAESFNARVDWDPSSSSVRIWLAEKVSARQVMVRGSYVNIRPGPGVEYNPPLEVVQKGTILPVLGAVPGWYQIQLADNRLGWINADLVDILTNPPSTDGNDRQGEREKKLEDYVAIAGSNPIAILAGPGPVYRQVGIAPAGSQLKVKEEQQGWLKVELEGGLAGWLPASLITLKPLESGSLLITGIEVKRVPEGIQLWIQGTKAFNYNTLRLYNPERIVWDIPGATLNLPKDKWEIEVGENGLARVRVSQYAADTVRIVADITSSLKFRETAAPEDKGRIFYLYIPSLKNSKIVLDPGHGTDPQGSDPGAIGPSGIKEKDVNLAIALKLADLLRAEGAQVYLTRSGENTTHRLVERALYANTVGADVFISIHSNASLNPEVGGTATYIYAPPDTELGQQREERLRLARCIQEALVAALGRRNIGVLEANFAVLRHTNMPSVLVEVAFISNPEEEQLLNNPAFQARAASGILEGLKRYFN